MEQNKDSGRCESGSHQEMRGGKRNGIIADGLVGQYFVNPRKLSDSLTGMNAVGEHTKGTNAHRER